jgi:hypothetical protein
VASPGRPAATSFASTVDGPSSNNSTKSLTYALTAVTGALTFSTMLPRWLSPRLAYVCHSAGSQRRTHPAMQCFFDTTEGVGSNTTFGVAETLVGLRKQFGGNQNICAVQEFDEGDASGMTISWRPYRRPSSENAPGPRQTRAAAMTVARAPVDLASNKFRLGGGNHENALPRLISPASAPANGVRYPISSETPLANASKATPKVTSPSSRQTRKQAAPWTTSALPMVTRNSSRPAPGHPSGNAENILSSGGLLHD